MRNCNGTTMLPGMALAAVGAAVLYANFELNPAWLLLPLGLSLVHRPAQAGLRCAALAAACFGLWAAIDVEQVLALSWPHDSANQPTRLCGTINSFPKRFAHHQQFDLVVEEIAAEIPLRRVRLNWYTLSHTLQMGDQWCFEAKLRRPGGSYNPAGLQAERTAMLAGRHATGTVHQGSQLADGSFGALAWWLRVRASVAGVLQDRPGGSLMAALIVGDRSTLSADQYEAFRAAGAGHLLAISGLHVGMVAGFIYLVVFGLSRLASRGGRVPAPRLAACAAVLVAFVYAALAGLSLPTQRALVMIALWQGSVVVGRPLGAGRSYWLAVLAVLLLAPRSVIGAGFWLSFGTVGALVAWFRWRPLIPSVVGAALQGQGVAILLSSAMAALWFGEVSLTGPLVNTVVIPWVSFAILPAALLGTAVVQLGGPVWLLDFAGYQLAVLSDALSWLAVSGPPAWQLAGPALAIALLTALLLIALPPGLRARFGLLAAVVLLAATRNGAPGEQLELRVFDVGQGLAALIRVGDRTLLYDTGPGHGAFSAAQAMVLPSLNRARIVPDRIIVSHADSDHSGGAKAVFERFSLAAVAVVAADDHWLAALPRCVRGQQWQWHGARFTVLHPGPHLPYLGNDSSCVLQVDFAGRSLLLPGDVSATVEARLIAMGERPVDVVIAGHHGSRTSSSQDFLEHFDPEHVIIARGQYNRFGMPHPVVLERLAATDAAIHDTANDGMVTIKISPRGEITVAKLRVLAARRWFYQRPSFR